MATEKLRIGLIGTVSYFNHHFGRAIKAVPEIEAVAVATLGRSASYIQHSLGEPLDEYVQRYGLALHEDPWEMAEREGLQAVYLATEDHLQSHYAIEAAKRGLHVFMHKPWASNLDDADAVIAVARESSVVVLPNLPNRFKPSLSHAQELVQAGVIGKPLMVDTHHAHHLTLGPWKSDPMKAAGPEIEVGFYECDTHRMLMAAEPVKVYCVSDNHQHPGVPFVDNLKATATFDSRGFGTLSMYYSTDFKFLPGTATHLVGEEGGIVVMNDDVTVTSKTGTETVTPEVEPYNTGDIRNWVHACLGLAASKTSLDEGRKTLQFCMALRASSRLGAPVTVPLDDQPEVLEAARPYKLDEFGDMPEPPQAAGVSA